MLGRVWSIFFQPTNKAGFLRRSWCPTDPEATSIVVGCADFQSRDDESGNELYDYSPAKRRFLKLGVNALVCAAKVEIIVDDESVRLLSETIDERESKRAEIERLEQETLKELETEKDERRRARAATTSARSGSTCSGHPGRRLGR